MYPIELRTLTPPTLFGRARQKEGWDHGGRVLSTHLWVFLMEGSAEFCIRDKSVTAERGACVFIPAGTFYAPRAPHFADYYFFHFNAKLCAAEEMCETAAPPPLSSPYFVLEPEAHGDMLALPFFMPRGTHSAEIEEALLRCERLVSEQGSEARLLFALEFYRVLALFARGTDKALPEALAAMCSYVCDHAREEVSLSSLSARFGFSPSYVARLFRVHLGTTVSAYRNDLRLGRAYRLLLNTDLRVGEIAEDCGFPDLYYFSRLMKRRYGRSPRILRREHGV